MKEFGRLGSLDGLIDTQDIWTTDDRNETGKTMDGGDSRRLFVSRGGRA